MEGTALLKIGDFSKLSRISVRMLRHYDEIGLLRPVFVDQFTDYRYYAENQLPIVGRITALKDMGFRLAEISSLLALYDDKDALDAHLAAQQKTLEALAEADIAEGERYIHSTGFFRAKAKDIVLASQMLLRDYGGRVPDTMEELLKLPGVGRKTANLILGDVYHVPGVVVADTHCIRISGLLGLTDGTKDPGKVEQQLRAILPPEESNDFCHRLVLHGRAVCMARKPDCPNCTLRPWCDFYTKS